MKSLVLVMLCSLPLLAVAGPDVSTRPKADASNKERPITSPTELAKLKLEAVFTCEEPSTPQAVKLLVKQLNGLQVIIGNEIDDAEYTLARPLNIYGREIRRISVHKYANEDGEFTEYSAIFTGEDLVNVAYYAGVGQSEDGRYMKAIGRNDLILRSERGETSIVCAQNVRTIAKSIKRAWRNITEPK